MLRGPGRMAAPALVGPDHCISGSVRGEALTRGNRLVGHTAYVTGRRNHTTAAPDDIALHPNADKD